MGADLPGDVSVTRIAGLGDVALAVEVEFEDGGPDQTPTVIGHDLGSGHPLLEELTLALTELRNHPPKPIAAHRNSSKNPGRIAPEVLS